MAEKSNAPLPPRRPWLWIAVLAMMIVPGIVSVLYLRSAPRKPIDSLAVLPFAALESDPATGPLGEQLAAGLIARLSEERRLHVAAWEEVQAYRNSDADARTIGHELGVRAVLRSRFERREGELLVHAELLDAGDNRTLWRQSYRVPLDNLAALEKQFATHLASFLRAQ